MDTYSYSSYAESGDSSPRCREVDVENQSWDEPPPANYKVRFMCSYGGKIQPRPHDNQLAYVGGDTKILAVDRSTKLAALTARLAALWDVQVSFKYQLPGEDLDALISVTNEEDLEHMMIEYDRLYRSSSRPARLRLFLFPLNFSSVPTDPAGETKPAPQWFVDALNSGPMQNGNRPETDLPATTNPDFLFGLDKGSAAKPVEGSEMYPSLNRPVSEDPPPPQSTQAVPEAAAETVHQTEIHRQVQEFQRMYIAGQDKQAAFFQRKEAETLIAQPLPAKDTEGTAGYAAGDYYKPKLPDTFLYDLPAPPQSAIPPPATASYWAPPAPDRQVMGQDSGTVYLLPAMYPGGSVRPIVGPPGQGGFYAIPPNMIAHPPHPPPPPAALVGDPYREGSMKLGTYTEGGAARSVIDPASYQHLAYVDPSGGGQVYYYATQAPPPPAAMGLRHQPASQASQDQKIKKPANMP